ncbi:MAG TPA: SPW repeat protein [Candidatus Acidoferrales bacterium]|nr:SPW repeat protein [Candidatus Acidoferrales bacterium]
MRNFYWFVFHLIVGLWLIISPFALGFTDMAQPYWNAIAVGAVVVVSSVLALSFNREHVQLFHGERKAA